MGVTGSNTRFLFFHQGGAFAQTLAKVGQLGSASAALAFDFDFLDPRGMQRENTFNAFPVADAPDREHFVEAVTATSDHHAGEDLDSFFVAFDNFGVHAHRIADREICRFFAKLFGFNFIK